MNKISSVDEFCRSLYSHIEVIDLGGNKLTTIPTALIHFLENLNQLTLINNDIQRLPNLIGRHKKLKNIQVDGNPLKTIRRPIIDGGSQRLIQYLHDKFSEQYDLTIEEWALKQDEEDKAMV